MTYHALTKAMHTNSKVNVFIKEVQPGKYNTFMHYATTRSKYCPMVYHTAERILAAMSPEHLTSLNEVSND